MSEERLSRKAILICRKYEIEEILQQEQQQLEELLLTSTDDRGQIGDKIERVEHLGSQLKLMQERIDREEQREIDRLAATEAGEEGEEEEDEDEEDEEDYPIARLGRIIAQIRAHHLQDEDEDDDEDDDDNDDESESEAEEADNGNQLYLNDPNIQQRFGHIFASADSSAVTPSHQRNRPRPEQNNNQLNFLQILASNRDLNDLHQLIQTLQNQIITVGGAVPSEGYEALSELEGVPVPIRSGCYAMIPTNIYHELPAELTTDKNKRCAICLCDYEKEDQVSHLPCDHLYHPDCIKEWFRTNAKCPVCKFDLNTLVDKDRVLTSQTNSDLLNEIRQRRIS